MSLSDAQIRQALMEGGALLPLNAKAVEASTQACSLPEERLPPGLSAERVLDRIRNNAAPSPAILKFPPAVVPTSAFEGLARAARNGEELSDEIIAAMQADRERIEGQSK